MSVKKWNDMKLSEKLAEVQNGNIKPTSTAFFCIIADARELEEKLDKSELQIVKEKIGKLTISTNREVVDTVNKIRDIIDEELREGK